MFLTYLRNSLYYASLFFLNFVGLGLTAIEYFIDLRASLAERFSITIGRNCCMTNRLEYDEVKQQIKTLEADIKRLEAEHGWSSHSVTRCQEENFLEQIEHKEPILNCLSLYDGVTRTFPLKKWGMVMHATFVRVRHTITMKATLYKKDNEASSSSSSDEDKIGGHKCAPLIQITDGDTQKLYYEYGRRIGTVMPSSMSWDITQPEPQEKTFDISVSHFNIASTNGVVNWQINNIYDQSVHGGPVFKTSEEGYLVMLDLIRRESGGFAEEILLKVTFLLGPDDDVLLRSYRHLTHVILSNPDDPKDRHVCEPQLYDLVNGSSHEMFLVHNSDLNEYNLLSSFNDSLDVKVYLMPA